MEEEYCDDPIFCRCLTVSPATLLWELTCHMESHSVTGRGDIPNLTPAKAGTRLSDPSEMQG